MRRLAFALLVLLCGNVTRGDGPVDSAATVRSFLDYRASIISGDVTITGRLINLVNDKPKAEQEIHERQVFDFSRSLLRIERSSADLVNINESGVAQESKPVLPTIEVANRDKVFLKQVKPKRIEIGSRSAEPNYWDIRTFGMATYDGFLNHCTLLDFERTFERISNEEKLPPSVTQDPESRLNIISLSYRFPDSPRIVGRRDIWIDPARDFVPVRMAEQFRDDKDEWRKPHSTSSATFEKLGGVFVPTSVIVELVMRPEGKPEHISRYELNLDWKSCNSPLDESLFTLEGLDSPPRSHTIVEHIEGKGPVTIQHPNVRNPETLKRFEADAKLTKNASPDVPLRLSTRWLIIGNLAIVSLIIGIVALRQRGKRHAPDNNDR